MTRLVLASLAILISTAPMVGQEQGEREQQRTRNDLEISGVYPHLTAYGIYSQGGAHLKPGHEECGIGAVVPWAGKLWMVTYAPHQPKGSEHKLHSISADLKQMTIHPESVGGTPAGRMIHAESNQLLIAHYLIDAEGNVRVIPPERMPIRVTAIARHLKDPAHWVYYVDMEGSIWEANVQTLEVNRLFKKPVPGWHGKGGYTAQRRLIVSNNGELHVGDYKDLMVGGEAKTLDEAGVLAEWDGKEWRIIERRQFTDITGPRGIVGGSDGDEVAWAIGWDRRSLRLKLLEDGEWSTYLLPKAALCNDARHGWYTEWPRIREIAQGRWMMDMHGMFFEFPPTFTKANSRGIKPIGSHLRYIPDFCEWNGKVVLASDETSIQGNPLAGQPQSNLWFGDYETLKAWGPSSAYGGPWIEDAVTAQIPSDPFLIDGFEQRMLHLAVGKKSRLAQSAALRSTDQQEIHNWPTAFENMPRITVARGDWHQPGTGYHFELLKPSTVYLVVDQRGEPILDSSWELLDWTVSWGQQHVDRVYRREFPAGTVEIPDNASEHTPGAFGMPHMAVVSGEAKDIRLIDSAHTKLWSAAHGESTIQEPQSMRFRLQIDVNGDGTWNDLETVEVPSLGYVPYAIPEDLAATWMRLVPEQNGIATAFFHMTPKHHPNPSEQVELFAGLAEVGSAEVMAGQVYAAKHNRNLRMISSDGEEFEFTKAAFTFEKREVDPVLRKLLEVKPEFTVDAASVVLEHRGRKLRLPKGDHRFDDPFSSGLPRTSREVQSERHLANIHGTFYEVPLLINGQPPAYELMRPVCSHSKQITDFCTWNGLLVICGVRRDASPGEHVFVSPERDAALWFGGIDDLWKLGKPTGHGGPWLNTAVEAGVASDPYLMTGYDRKTLTISADVDTQVTLEVDFDHQSGWHAYRELELKAGIPTVFEFPAGFSAHWIRFRMNDSATATAQLDYK